MRLITIVSQSDFFIPWDLGINEEEFKIYLFQELENTLNSILRINKMLDAEPVEAEIKCGGCGKTNETNWVFCYGNKFRVCRFCATQINPEHRTPIENDTMEYSDNESDSDSHSQSDNESEGSRGKSLIELETQFARNKSEEEEEDEKVEVIPENYES